MPPSRPRFLFYSHDSYGLGHLSRTLAIAGAVLRSNRRAGAVVLTGSPVPETFALPPRCAIVRLPPITKDASGAYVARDGSLTPSEVHAERGAIACRTALDYRPDLFLVDHTPAGAGGELLPVLEALRLQAPRCRIVLGMRDIIDEPVAVRERFLLDETLRLLSTVYEAILIYGARAIFDPIVAYGLPEEVAVKVHFTGYLGRNGARAERVEPGSVLVTAGGGEDGGEVLRAYLRDMEKLNPSRRPPSLLVPGPLLAAAELLDLERRARGIRGVRLRRVVSGLEHEIARADMVVCRAGYNTLCEALGLNRRVLAVPRHQYRKEQRLRASVLAAGGFVDALLDSTLAPGVLAQRVIDALQGGPSPDHGAALPLDGLAEAARVLDDLIKARRDPPAPRARAAGARGFPGSCTFSTS